MTWGALYMYYHCPKCGMKFEYALDVMTEFGDEFGFCPECHVMGVYEKEGARQVDDNEYFEVEYERDTIEIAKILIVFLFLCHK